VFGANWVVANINDVTYLDYMIKRNYFTWWIQKFGTWILIFTNFVPISLMVTLEVVKFL